MSDLNKRHHWSAKEVKVAIDRQGERSHKNGEDVVVQGGIKGTWQRFAAWFNRVEELPEETKRMDAQIKKEVVALFVKAEKDDILLGDSGSTESLKLKLDIFNMHLKVNYPLVYADRKHCVRLMEELGLLPKNRMSF